MDKLNAQQQAQPWERRAAESREDALYPATKALLTQLPPDAKLDTLAAKFPRIANLIAHDWSRPETLKPYLRDLMTTDRPGREGFPPEILRELFAFVTHYTTEVFPDRKSIWDDVL